MLFQIPAQVDNVRTLKDGSFRITFETQEIPNPEEVAKLFELKKQGLGWVLFKAATITPEDIPAYDPATFDEIKPPQTLTSCHVCGVERGQGKQWRLREFLPRSG